MYLYVCVYGKIISFFFLPHLSWDQWWGFQHGRPGLGFPSGSVVKNPPARAGDKDLIPGSGGSPREGNGNRSQYSCLENPRTRGVWQATVHGVAESDVTEHPGNQHWICVLTLWLWIETWASWSNTGSSRQSQCSLKPHDNVELLA